MMYCPACGKHIPDLSNFCLECGKAVLMAQSAAPLAQPSRSQTTIPMSRISRKGPIAFSARSAYLLSFRSSSFWHSRQTGSIGPRRAGTPRHPRYTVHFAKPCCPVRSPFETGPTMTNAHVTGNFHASGGSANDIEAIVAEWGECENWINSGDIALQYLLP